MDGISSIEAASVPSDLVDRLVAIEEENSELRKLISNLNDLCLDSQKRISTLEASLAYNDENNRFTSVSKNAVDDDDGVDLFASESEEETEEAARVRKERLAVYAAKKSKKPALTAKSSLVLDVKPWDDETDLKQMEVEIRKIAADGLLWGASKLVPVAFGIWKISITCVVEDDNISVDWLTGEIEKIKDFVQSVDVAAFNKI